MGGIIGISTIAGDRFAYFFYRCFFLCTYKQSCRKKSLKKPCLASTNYYLFFLVFQSDGPYQISF